MFDAVVKSLAQMVSPPFRELLLKAMGLALILVVLIGVLIHRLLIFVASIGENWAESMLGSAVHTPLAIMSWILSVAAGLGIVVGSVLLMPAVTAVVGTFFVDDIALAVEREHYRDEPLGTPLPFVRAMLQGLRTAFFAVLVYLIALPSLFFAGLGAVVFFIATAYLLGREYFGFAAMRYRTPAAARSLRKENQGWVFVAGMFIAAFVSIPVVSLATPLFAMALMVHLHKLTMPRGQHLITCCRAS